MIKLLKMERKNSDETCVAEVLVAMSKNQISQNANVLNHRRTIVHEGDNYCTSKTPTENPNDPDIIEVWTMPRRPCPVGDKNGASLPDLYEVKVCKECAKYKDMTHFQHFKSPRNEKVYTRGSCKTCIRRNEKIRARAPISKKESQTDLRALQAAIIYAKAVDNCRAVGREV